MFSASSLLYGCPRTFIASIMNGGLSPRTSKGSRLFQMMLQIHIVYNIRMISVLYSSKDWSFSQIFA